MAICKNIQKLIILNLYKPENMKDYTIKYIKTEDSRNPTRYLF